MGRRLAGNVVLRNPETNQVELFGAGAEPPAWAADLITNPDAWADDTAEAPQETKPATTGASERPPKAGTGSGRDAWVAYAEGLGIEVTDEMGRDEIVELVDAHTAS
jgi:hypothetical protein